MNSIQIEIKSQLSELRKLRKYTEDFYKDIVDEIELDRILLAIEEAVSNVILHGYKNLDDEIIQVELGYSDTEIVICIKDNAPFFDGNKIKLDPKEILQNASFGLGIFLMKKIMNIQYEPNQGGGNCLYMKKINYLKKK